MITKEKLRRVICLLLWGPFGAWLFDGLSGATAGDIPRKGLNAEVHTSAGLRIAHDRRVEQWLDAAIVHLDRDEFGLASSVLARVLTGEQDYFIRRETTVVVARDAAWKLAKKLPQDLLRRLEEDLDRSAFSAWAVARQTNSTAEIASLAVRYRFSLSGVEALRTLAALFRDTSQHQLSAVAWEHIAEHPRASLSYRTAARVAQVESLISAKRFDEASAVIGFASGENLAATVTVAGRPFAPRDWLEVRGSELKSLLPPLPPPESADAVPNSIVHPTSRAMDLIPAFFPIWSQPTAPQADLAKDLLARQTYFQDQCLVSSMVFRPLVVGPVILARTIDHLLALELGSGKRLWSRPNAGQESGANRTSDSENVSNPRSVVESWQRRLEADSIFGSLASDGQILVAVIDPPADPSLRSPAPQISTDEFTSASVPWNRLSAVGVSTGLVRWEIGGPKLEPAGGLRFLGPPLPVDELWFVIAQRDDELLLLAIDNRTGQIDWSFSLGIIPPSLAASVARQRIACPVSFVAGVLLCPTASGALIAVDPVTRGARWVFRYPTEIRETPIRPRNRMGLGAVVDSWWNEWRAVSCMTSTPLRDGEAGAAPALDLSPSSIARNRRSEGKSGSGRRVILASPESEKLQAVDLDDGHLVWSVSRNAGLHVAGLFQEFVVVIEPTAVRGHDLQTGAVRWRCETGEISGCGTLFASKLLQPRRSGGVAVVDLNSGLLQDSFIDSRFVLGTLIRCPEGWISQTDQSLILLPTLTQARQKSLTNRETNPTDPIAALQMAVLDLQAGEAAAARNRLRGIDTAEARALQQDALLSLIRVSQNATPDESVVLGPSVERNVLEQELLALSRSNDDRLSVLRALGELFAVGGDYRAAVNAFLDGLELLDSTARRTVIEWPADAVSGGSVRRDRVFVGDLADSLRSCAERAVQTRTNRMIEVDEGEGKSTAMAQDHRQMSSVHRRETIERLLQERLESSRGSSDPFAVQRLIDRLLPLDWGRKTLMEELTAAQFARSLKKSEAPLLALTMSRNAPRAAAAARILAQRLAQSGWRADADAVERRLLLEHPGMVGDGDQFEPRFDGKSKPRERLASLPVDPWPPLVPSLQCVSKTHSDDVHCIPVFVDAMPGSLLDRLDVSIQRHGKFIRFAGEGHPGKWILRLPDSQSVLRTSFASNDQYEAWGLGRLLVLRIGGELFGIFPLDERGEPQASLAWAWPRDTDAIPRDLAKESFGREESIPARVGLRHERIRMLDEFGHVVASVGPVRPDYLCYQSQGKLVALETQTGKRLWERRHVPVGCVSFGDEDRVYLWNTSERTLVVLSAVDGRTCENRPWEFAADDLLMQQGSLCWFATENSSRPDRSLDLQLRDACDGSVQWSNQFAATAIPFVMDRDTIGVVELTGVLHLLAAKTGVAWGAPISVELPNKIERIVCHQDVWRWYVAFSGPILKQAGLFVGGRRTPLLNGPWYAINRATKEILWQRTLANAPLSLDESRMAPVFVQMWCQREFHNNSSNTSDGRIRVIDRRTGGEVAISDAAQKIVRQLQPYFTLHPSSGNDMLDIRTENTAFRLKFADVEQ